MRFFVGWMTWWHSRFFKLPLLIWLWCGCWLPSIKICMNLVYHMQQEKMKSPTFAFWLPSDICSANVSFLWVCSLTRWLCHFELGCWRWFLHFCAAAPQAAFTSCVLQNSSPEWHAPELSWAHLGSFFGWELDSSQISQTPRRHEVFRFDTQSLDPSACLVAWVVWGPRCQDACFEPETVWGGIVWIMSYFAGWSQLVSRIPFSIQKCLWCVDSTNSISMWIWNICNICILEVGNQPIQYGFISIVFHNQDR